MKIRPPFGGVHEGEALTSQPDGTTREAYNVRERDPVTGMKRISSRCGLSKYASAQINGSSKIKRMVQVSADGRNVTYHNSTSSTYAADTEISTAFDCAVGRVDKSSNAYVVDGKESLIKYSADGKEVWRVTMPHKAHNHTVRAMWVGDDDVVYAAVSAGGRIKDAAIYRFIQYFNAKQEVRAELYWEFTTKQFVEDMVVKDGVLYTIQNVPDENRADLVLYNFLASDKPVEMWRRDIPYPAQALAVSPKDGSAFVASDSNQLRGFSSFDPLHTGVYVDATLEDLIPHLDIRLWAHLDGQDIDGNKTFNASYKDGDQVNVWTDKSGNGRHMFSRPGVRTIPVYNDRACSGKGGVKFYIDAGLKSEMISGVNTGIAPEAASQQKTLVPGYTGAMWVKFIVVRWDTDATVNTDVAPLFTYRNNAGTSANFEDTSDDALFINADLNISADPARLPPSISPGSVYYRKGLVAAPYAQMDPTAEQNIVSQTPPSPYVRSNVAILTIINGANDSTVMNSSVRVNGYQSVVSAGAPETARTLVAPVTMGNTFSGVISTGHGSGNTWLNGGFEGDFLEVIVLRDYQATPGGAKQLIDTAAGTTALSEIQRIEGYLAWKWGISHLLSPAAGAGAFAGSNKHPYFVDSGPPKIDIYAANSSVPKLFGAGTMLSKYSSTQGTLKWVVADPGASGANNTGLGGLGYGVAVTPAGYVVSCGPKSTTPVSGPSTLQLLQTNAVVRGIDDRGDTAYSDWDVAQTAFPGQSVYAWAWAYAPFEASQASTGWLAAAVVGPPNLGATVFGQYLYKYPRLGACQVDSNYDWGGTLSDIVTVPLILGDGSTGEQKAATIGMWNMQADSLAATNRVPVVELTLPQGQLARTALPDLNMPIFAPQSDITLPEIVVSFSAQATVSTLTCSVNFTATQTVRVGTQTYTFVDPADPAANFQVDLGADLTTSLRNLQRAINRDETDTSLKYFSDFLDAGAGGGTPVNLDYACIAVTSTTLTVRKKSTNDDTTLSSSNGTWAGGILNTKAIHRTRTVTTTVASGPTRVTAILGASGTAIRKVTTAGGTSISGGEGVIDSGSQYVSGATLFGEAFFVDGITKNLLVYNALAGQMQPLRAKHGKIPERCRLVASWNSRIICLRGMDQPESIFFSKRGDARNWDFYPPKPSANQAVWLSASAEMGLVPDIPQAFFGWQDDFALIGCMNSLYRLTGDPAQGGVLHLITNKTGTAFGDKAFARDDRGAIYLASYPNGGIWRMGSPLEQPKELTESAIPRRLRDLDWTKYTVELTWDVRRHGLWVIPVPYASTGEAVDSFFWSREHNAWWPDDLVNTAMQFTSTLWYEAEDGSVRDPLVGCMDGYVRRFDDAAWDDDGVATDSRILIGPAQDPNGDLELLFDDLGVRVSQAQSPLNYEVYAPRTPEDLGKCLVRGRLQRGINGVEARCSGPQVYVRLRSASVGSRWSIEDMNMQASPAGFLRDA
jgi:hypothetical protein